MALNDFFRKNEKKVFLQDLSMENGFFVRFSYDGKVFVERTQGFCWTVKQRFSFPKKWFFHYFCFFSFWYCLTRWLVTDENAAWALSGVNVIHTIFILFFAYYLSFVLDFMLFAIEDKRWHACAHKVLNLIYEKSNFDMEDLKKIKRFTPGCGSLFYSKNIFISMAGMISFVFFDSFDKIYFSILFSVSLLMAYIFACTWGNWLIQYFFTTAEPTNEQYEESLALAKRLIERLKNEKIIDD